MKQLIDVTSEFTLPDLVQIQRESFRWFIEKGLSEVLASFPSIMDPSYRVELQFFGREYKIKFPKFNVREAKYRDKTYSAQIYVAAKLHRKDLETINYPNTDKVNQISKTFIDSQRKHKVYRKRYILIADLPLMTNRGTFVISGTERVIVNQIVRSPGVYYKQETDKNDKYSYIASIISNRGSWLKFEIDTKGQMWVRIDKTQKINILVFLRAIGLSTSDIQKGINKYLFIVSSSQSYAG